MHKRTANTSSNYFGNVIWYLFIQAVIEQNVGGNLFGDGFQNGGVLVVDKGGKTLHHYVQDGPADHEDNAKILNVSFRSNERTDLKQVGDMNNLH